MRKVSAAVRATMSRRRNFVNYARMTLANGTVLNLEPKDFRINGNEFTDDVVDGEDFQVGTALGKSITVRLDNTDDRFSEYDFYMSYFYLYVHLPEAYTDGDGNLQDAVLNIGKFTVVEPVTTGTVIEFSGVDEMYKFDQSFDNCTLDFNTHPTLYTLLVRCCTDCGVAIGFTNAFDNATFTVSEKPDGVTYREVVSYICQIAGMNAKINENGALYLTWFNLDVLEGGVDGGTFKHISSDTVYQDGDNVDGGSFNPWDVGDIVDGGSFTTLLDYHHLFNIKGLVVSTDDIEFTGVRVVNDTTVVMVGTDDYVLEVKENPFTVSHEDEIAQFLFAKLNGFKFRPFSCSHLQDPTIEAGDSALLWDTKGNVYKTIITNVSFTTNGFMSISANAKSPTKQASTYRNPAAQAVVQARRNTEKQIDAYASTVDHFNEIANNALGYYRTDKVESGATVTYLHDQSTLEASTYIIKINSAGMFISEDGGESYTGGLEVSTATMLLNLVYVHGITADWVTSGIFQDSLGNFVLDMNTGTLKLDLNTQVGTGNTLQSMVNSINANAEGLSVEISNRQSEYNSLSSRISSNSSSISAEVTRAKNAESALNANYNGNYIPTLNNSPASDWTTDALKKAHLNDIFINNSTGDVYMFTNTKYGVKITFNSACETEGVSWDYVRIYYYDSSIGTYRYTENLGGRLPGNNIAGRSIIIPTNNFYVYWRTDGSGTGYYGFSIDSCEVVQTSEDEISALFPSTGSLPASVTNTLYGISTRPETSHNYTENNQTLLWNWYTQLSIPSSSGYTWSLQTDMSNVTSQLSIQAGEIASKVSTTDFNGNEIVSKINQTATTVQIDASKVNITGFVTFNDLSTSGQTTINGSNITTGEISADRIHGGTLTLGGVNNIDGSLSVYDASNVLKFQLDNSGFVGYSKSRKGVYSYETHYNQSGTFSIVDPDSGSESNIYMSNVITYKTVDGVVFAYIGIYGSETSSISKRNGAQTLCIVNTQSGVTINGKTSLYLHSESGTTLYTGNATASSYLHMSQYHVWLDMDEGSSSHRVMYISYDESIFKPRKLYIGETYGDNVQVIISRDSSVTFETRADVYFSDNSKIHIDDNTKIYVGNDNDAGITAGIYYRNEEYGGVYLARFHNGILIANEFYRE